MIPMSNEVAADLYRLAQAERLLRFYRECGLSFEDGTAQQAGDLDVSPILGPDGKIRPEWRDFEAVDSSSA